MILLAMKILYMGAHVALENCISALHVLPERMKEEVEHEYEFKRMNDQSKAEINCVTYALSKLR